MFWSRKKPRKTIKDPVAKYGEILRNNRALPKRSSKKAGLINKIFRSGCDSDFVYYDE